MTSAGRNKQTKMAKHSRKNNVPCAQNSFFIFHNLQKATTDFEESITGKFYQDIKLKTISAVTIVAILL